VPIFELFTFGPAAREAISNGASLDELRRVSKESGMRTLREDAMRIAEEGTSSLAEVIRVTYSED
jgi:type II secretory ATPase GspE/PulE/Tfp pilus assembly ATPase PilB-like protein